MSEIGNNREATRKALTMTRGRPVGIDYFSAEAYRQRVGAIVREFAGGAR